MRRVWLCIAAGAVFAPVSTAQVSIKRTQDVVQVEIDGKSFGALYTGPDAPKPYFAPLRSASGKIVTRQWPMVKDAAETHDHQHHRGMWLGYIDVNGSNFWENEFSYHRANAGKIVAENIEIASAKGKSGSIRGSFNWIDSRARKY